MLLVKKWVFIWVIACCVNNYAIADNDTSTFKRSAAISLGLLAQENKATISVTGLGDAPSDITLQDLGLAESKTLPQMGLHWRFSEKLILNLSYETFDISGESIIGRPLNFKREKYPISTSLKSDLQLDTLSFSIDYLLHEDDRLNWGLGIGLHTFDFSSQISASIGNTIISGSGQNFTTPVPNFRAFSNYGMTSKLTLGASFGYMSATLDNYSGSIFLADTYLSYQITRHWRFQVNYQYSELDLKIEGESINQAYDIRLKGAGVMVLYTF